VVDQPAVDPGQLLECLVIDHYDGEQVVLKDRLPARARMVAVLDVQAHGIPVVLGQARIIDFDSVHGELVCHRAAPCRSFGIARNAKSTSSRNRT
jgi:hypothetical protein